MSKLFRIYKLLKTEQTLNLCRNFILSPYHNPQRTDRTYMLLELFDAIKTFKGNEVEDHALSYEAYPDLDFHEKNFSRAKSELTDLIAKFLVLELGKGNNIDDAIDYLRILRSNKLSKDFENVYKKILLDLEKQSLRNEHYFRWCRSLHEEYSRYYTEEKRQHNYEAYEQIEQAINNEFMCQKLRLTCITFNHKKQKNQINAIENSFDDLFFSHVKALNENRELPVVIKMYFHCYVMLKEDSVGAYQQLKYVLNDCIYNLKNSNYLISDLELKEIFTLIANFCTKQGNIGNQTLNFLEELDDWYQRGLDAGILLENGYIYIATYKNIIVTRIKLKKYDAAERFINNFKSKLEDKEKVDAEKYTVALMHIRNNQVEEARQVVANGLSRSNYFNTLILYRAQIKKYYDERNDYLEHNIDNFDTYISTHQEAIDYHYETNRSFLTYTKKIYKLRKKSFNHSITTEEKEYLLELIYQKNPAEKEWLLDCVNKIK